MGKTQNSTLVRTNWWWRLGLNVEQGFSISFCPELLSLKCANQLREQNRYKHSNYTHSFDRVRARIWLVSRRAHIDAGERDDPSALHVYQGVHVGESAFGARECSGLSESVCVIWSSLDDMHTAFLSSKNLMQQMEIKCGSKLFLRDAICNGERRCCILGRAQMIYASALCMAKLRSRSEKNSALALMLDQKEFVR
jgi:hypothetical protein